MNRHASTSTATHEESISDEVVHVDRDRRRVLLGQGQELVAELAGRRPVDLADDLDVDIALVTGDGTGEDGLLHVRAPSAVRSPSTGRRSRVQRREALTS